MDTSVIPGFITRKQASERCERAERTLQRYWSRAVGQQDRNVLQHLKLRTEDGKVLDGTDVTKQLIEKLKTGGQNPTWFVHALWVEKTYGPRPRLGSETEKKSKDERGGEGGKQSTLAPDALKILQEQIAKLEEDKRELREELKIKNQQITEANERGRETNVLMRDLHKLLGNMQQRLLPLPQRALPENNLPPPKETQPPPATEHLPSVTPSPQTVVPDGPRMQKTKKGSVKKRKKTAGSPASSMRKTNVRSTQKKRRSMKKASKKTPSPQSKGIATLLKRFFFS